MCGISHSHLLRLAGPLLIALSISGSSAFAAESARKPRVSSTPHDLSQTFNVAYSIIIEGSRADALRYSRIAAQAATAAEAATRRNNGQLARQQQALADIARGLAEVNEAIGKLFEQQTIGEPMRQAMKRLQELEARWQALTGARAERTWLTFDEVEALHKANMVPIRRKQGVLPFGQGDWRKPDR